MANNYIWLPTADYIIPTAVTYALPAEPTAEDLILMDTNFSASNVINSSYPATIGMFGVPNATDPLLSKYYFYFKFKPADSNFYTVTGPVTFRVIFQMGNTSSDWTGVRWYNDTLGAA